MAELLNYPFVNQLNSPTLDGRPDENKWFNCVICSILSAMFYWRPDLRGKITPDSMKDAVLGENYQNKGTDAAWFVDFVAQYGLKLYKIQGIPGQLITMAHQLIQSGKPAIFTEIDPYVDTRLPQYAGWTHVCSWFKEAPNGLVAMDPFGGKLVEKTDDKWLELIVGNELWTVERIEDVPVTIDIHNPAIAARFDELNPHQWRSKKTGKIIQYGMLANYKQEGNSGLCGLDELGDVLSNELPLQGYPQGSVKQYYEFGARGWNAATGKVFPLALYGGPGEDPRVAEKQAQIDQLKQQLAAQPQPVADPAPLNAIHQIQTLIAPFK